MSNKAEKRGLVPKLRFPEFREAGEWHRRKLNELLFETKRRNRDLKYSRQDVLSVSGEFGCVNQIELLGRSYAGVSVKDYHIVETGDVVYTKSPLKKNPFGIIKENKGKPGIVSTLYAVYRATSICHPAYLDYYFSSDFNLNCYLQPIVKIGAKNDMKVNNAYVLSGKVPAPKIQEQKKIADCLASLDELITLESQQLDTLKTYKEGLMQQLLPAEGETLPKLRFPEFRDAGEWEEVPLSELVGSLDAGVSVNSGDRPATGNEIGVLKTSAVTNGIFEPRENKVVFDEVEIGRVKESVQGDTIIISRMNTPALVGANAYVKTSLVNLFLPDRLWAAKSKPGTSMRFVALILGSDKGRAALSKLAKGSSGSMKNITKPDVLAFLIMAPSSEEQQKIADCLASLDDLIAAHTQKLVALKTHKKGLMQQLFPDTATTPPLRGTPPEEGNGRQNSPPLEGWQAKPDGVV